MLWLCKPVSSKKRFAPFRHLDRNYSFSLYEKAEHLPEDIWNGLCPVDKVFLQKAYLQIVERCSHSKLNCRYVIVQHKLKACGILYFQIIDFKAGVFGELVKNQVEGLRSKRMSLFEKYIDNNKEEILMRLFTCGNNLVSGEFGFAFSEEISQTKQSQLLLGIMDIVAREEKLRGTISASLIKDFYHPLQPAKHYEREGFSSFNIEPNMMVEIPAGVKSLEEYTEHFSKKYRKRARQIWQNKSELIERELDLQDLKLLKKDMFRLYESIFNNAKFKLLKLPEDYFVQVKQCFPDQFKVKGFFLGEHLLAFGTCFRLRNGELEAHYIGFDYTQNNTYDLYQNLLYALIQEGIERGCRSVNLGRTASEIKTTVGAKPHELFCYIKAQNTISRIIQKPFIQFLQPGEWTPRNPFKEERAEDLQETEIRGN